MCGKGKCPGGYGIPYGVGRRPDDPRKLPPPQSSAGEQGSTKHIIYDPRGFHYDPIPTTAQAGSAVGHGVSGGALCAFPLYIDKFSNLGVVKFTAVCTLCWAFALWLGALRAVGAVPQPAACRGGGIRRFGRWGLSQSAVWCPRHCRSRLRHPSGGLGGYYGGCMMVLFTAAGYLAVRAFAPQSLLNGLTFGVGVTTAIVTVLYVLNIFNIDLIGTYADTAVVERAQFFFRHWGRKISAPALWRLRCRWYSTPFWRAACGTRSCTAFRPSSAVWRSRWSMPRGLTLGIGAAVLVLLCQRMFTTRTLRRLAVIGGFFFFHAGGMQYMRTHVYTQGGKPMLAALGRNGGGPGLCSALSFGRRWFGLRGREVPLYRLGRCVAAAVVATAAVLFLLANLWPGFPSLGRLDEVLIVNDDWGTYRGTAWRITAASWLDQPLWRKLLGVGPGMMHTAVANWAGADITDRMKTFYAAHNEYLELLLTTGVVGLAAWLWFVAAHLRRAAQNWLRPAWPPVTLALVSYLAHAVISIRVSMIFPEIMLLFALFAGVLPAAGGGCRAGKTGKARQEAEGCSTGGAARTGAAVAAADRGRHCDDGGLRCSLAGDLWVFVLRKSLPCQGRLFMPTCPSAAQYAVRLQKKPKNKKVRKN